MTERELMAAKYKGTAFECLFIDRPAAPTVPDKKLADMERRKRNNARNNAKRAANNIKADTKQKANWRLQHD